MTKIIYSYKLIMEKIFNVNSSLSITSLQLQKEINVKTNKTSKPANHLNQLY